MSNGSSELNREQETVSFATDKVSMIYPPAPASRTEYWLTSGPTPESRLLQAVASYQRRLHDGQPFEPTLFLAYELAKSLHLLGCRARIFVAVGKISARNGTAEELVALLGTDGELAAGPADDPLARHYVVWVPEAKRLIDITAFTRLEFYRLLRERPELTWPMILGASVDTLPEERFPLVGAPRDEFVIRYVIDPSASVPLSLVEDDERLVARLQERILRIAYAAGSAIHLFAITSAHKVSLSERFSGIFGDVASARDALSHIRLED